MAYPNTSSTLLGPQGQNRTSIGISTNILIVVGNTAVGAVQDLNFDEARPVKTIEEIGTDGNIDSVPIGATKINGSCTRIRFDRMRIAEAFSRGYVHVASQRFPFDIIIFDKWGGDAANALTTTIKNVWIKQISTKYNADNWIITDTMTWEAETVYTRLGSNSQASQGGTQGIPRSIDAIEQATDRGERRGSLDAPGLINQFLNF